MKKTPKPVVINDSQTFLDFQKVAKLLLTCLEHMKNKKTLKELCVLGTNAQFTMDNGQ